MRGSFGLFLSLTAVFVVCGTGFGQAQALLPVTDGVDLTLPPDLRGGPVQPAAPAASPLPQRVRRGDAFQPDARRASADRPPRARVGDPHPVDVGVTLRGGSATPRFTAATGTSQAVRESGSAFGAGMRVGF